MSFRAEREILQNRRGLNFRPFTRSDISPYGRNDDLFTTWQSPCPIDGNPLANDNHTR